MPGYRQHLCLLPGKTLPQAWITGACQRPVYVKAIDLSFGKTVWSPAVPCQQFVLSRVVGWKDMDEEDAAGFSQWDQSVSHHTYVSFLNQGKLRELDYPSSWSLAKNTGRAAYWDNKTKTGRTSVKIPPSHAELYLRAAELSEVPHASTTWKIQGDGRRYDIFQVQEYMPTCPC